MTRDSHKPLAVIAIRQVEKSTGASRNAFEQAVALGGLGYRVVILAERGRPALAEHFGAELVRLWRWPLKGPFRRFWFNRRVQAWCRRQRPALLVSHGDVETPDTVYMHNCVHLASRLIHGRELPAGHEVAAIHDHVLSGGQFRQVAVNSRLMAEDFQARYGIDAAKIEISYPGYDPETFNIERAREDRHARRQALGAHDDTFLIGLITSGNFTKRNVAGFVEMATALTQRLPGRCRFLVVGKDDAAPYRQQAAAAGIADAFEWRSTVSDVETLYGALDLFVLPAHIEEFGRVSLEAMACGTPVLLSRTTGAAELLEESHSDLILDSRDTQGWVERIERLIEQDDRTALGESLSQLASAYSYRRQTEKLKRSFEALMQSRGSVK
ncbi:glycosyltransferase family 4 protein [Salinicola sp. JS01]|uniref:glycosyltransferase family 4 protein n=1 Tax=Salinicola sp. JS01 TaxID=3050071 RepID=UPI00255BF3A1|nr:glycosyltransferase family 4 protein [Salinicola sp. JS01]WIX32885.1 glycosyltransferase family 4 protein [Salinicola sp. JS01]